MRDLRNLLVLPTTGFVTCRIWMDISRSRGEVTGKAKPRLGNSTVLRKKKVDSKDRSRFPPSGASFSHDPGSVATQVER